MLGSGSNNLEDTQELLAQLEACQDEMDAALSRSEFSAVIDLNETRISILASGVASNFKASCDSDINRLAALRARLDYSISILKERMQNLGVDTGRHKRALVGYRRGL